MSWTVTARDRAGVVRTTVQCHDGVDAEYQRAELAAVWGRSRVTARPDPEARAEAHRAIGGGRHG